MVEEINLEHNHSGDNDDSKHDSTASRTEEAAKKQGEEETPVKQSRRRRRKSDRSGSRDNRVVLNGDREAKAVLRKIALKHVMNGSSNNGNQNRNTNCEKFETKSTVAFDDESVAETDSVLGNTAIMQDLRVLLESDMLMTRDQVTQLCEPGCELGVEYFATAAGGEARVSCSVSSSCSESSVVGSNHAVAHAVPTSLSALTKLARDRSGSSGNNVTRSNSISTTQLTILRPKSRCILVKAETERESSVSTLETFGGNSTSCNHGLATTRFITRWVVLHRNMLYFFDTNTTTQYPLYVAMLDSCRVSSSALDPQVHNEAFELCQKQDPGLVDVHCITITASGDRTFTLAFTDRSAHKEWNELLVKSSYETLLEHVELLQRQVNVMTHDRFSEEVKLADAKLQTQQLQWLEQQQRRKEEKCEFACTIS